MSNDYFIRMKVICIFILFCCISCKKYEEGPALSFRSASKRLQGSYSVQRIIVDGVEKTLSYYDSCGCDFFFPEKKYFYLELTNCKGSGQNKVLPGRCSIIDGSLNLRFYEKSPYYDSIFGFGPFNYEMSSLWEIRRLSNTELIIETNFDNKYYRLELSE